MSFIPSDILPSSEEGIGITFVKEDKYAIIEIYNTGDILAAYSRGSDNPDIWEVSTSQGELSNTISQLISLLDE